MKEIWIQMERIDMLGNLCFIYDVMKSTLNPMSMYYQETSHLPWEYIRFYEKNLKLWDEMIKDLESVSNEFNTVYRHFPTLLNTMQQLSVGSTITFKGCELKPSYKTNINQQNPFFPNHKKYIKFLKLWKEEISSDKENTLTEHTMIIDSICPVSLISNVNKVVNRDMSYLNYLKWGVEKLELLCQYIDRDWMKNTDKIIKQYNKFKERVYLLITEGKLIHNFEKSKKKLNRKWRLEYELIKLFDTDNALYNGIETFWNLFVFFYSQGMSETDCESAYSTIKYSTAHRPNLKVQRIGNIIKIKKNGPNAGDEDEFLYAVSNICAIQFNPPLAVQSKYIVSRALEEKLNRISPLDFRQLLL